MATGRVRPPAPAPAKPASAAPAQAEPHPRLKRLAKEVGAEVPLPPVEKEANAEKSPRSFWFTLRIPKPEK